MRWGGSAGAGEGVGLTPRWREPPRAVLGLQLWGLEPSYAGLREGSGAGRRAALGYVEKGFSSSLYRGVPEGSAKVSGILRATLRSPLRPTLRGI